MQLSLVKRKKNTNFLSQTGWVSILGQHSRTLLDWYYYTQVTYDGIEVWGDYVTCTAYMHVVFGRLSKISMCNQYKIEWSCLSIGQSYFHCTRSFVAMAWYLQKIPDKYPSARTGLWPFQGFLGVLSFHLHFENIFHLVQFWAIPLLLYLQHVTG